MNEFIKWAEDELKYAGLFDEDSDYHSMIGKAVLELIECFSGQGHSGVSAVITANVLYRLLSRLPLTPLMGDDSEWVQVSENLWQNKRCYRIFKDNNGRAWDIEGKVFVNPDGSTYTDESSKVFIEFPYMPRTEYVRDGIIMEVS
jgi:hypothetical protein